MLLDFGCFSDHVAGNALHLFATEVNVCPRLSLPLCSFFNQVLPFAALCCLPVSVQSVEALRGWGGERCLSNPTCLQSWHREVLGCSTCYQSAVLLEML